MMTLQSWSRTLPTQANTIKGGLDRRITCTRTVTNVVDFYCYTFIINITNISNRAGIADLLLFCVCYCLYISMRVSKERSCRIETVDIVVPRNVLSVDDFSYGIVHVVTKY